MSSTYCPLPFKHAYIDPQGISTCCRSTRISTTLDQWSTHPHLLNVQQEILNNKIPADCQVCHSDEEKFNNSLRLDALKDYKNQIFTTTEIDFIDYRSSNICNFKCRSCNSIFSHGIAQETRTHDTLKTFHPIVEGKTASVDNSDYRWIINNLGQLNRLMFTGGEPTMMPGVKNIIEEVLKNHKDRIQILITSNASFTDKFWFDITKELTNLHWTVSIDAVGSAAEIIRHGTDWTLVENNVRWLTEHANSLDINTVISNINLFQLGPLLKFGREMQLNSISPRGKHGDSGCRHQFYICQRPYWLSADNLPADLIQPAIEYLGKCLSLDLNQEQYQTVANLKKHLANVTHSPYLWSRSQEYNQILDRIRHEDSSVLFKYEPNNIL